MLRLLGGLAVAVAGIASGYWLMVWDAHFLLLATLGAACGAIAGQISWGLRGALLGSAVGFVLPLVYFPAWFVLDLPPNIGMDL